MMPPRKYIIEEQAMQAEELESPAKDATPAAEGIQIYEPWENNIISRQT
jgi:hypothetical protein